MAIDQAEPLITKAKAGMAAMDFPRRRQWLPCRAKEAVFGR